MSSSSSSMRAARFYGNRDIRVEDVPIPKAGPGECLVEVEWCGICGSDLHEYAAGPILMSPVDPKTGEARPLIFGHEFCGTLKSVPEGSKLQVGQAVMVDPHCICRSCASCAAGDDHVCPKLGFLGGSSGRGGGLSEYVAVEEVHCLPLPANVSLDDAAVIEPLVVCHHAAKAAGMDLQGRNVLILGGGPVGAALMAVLRAHRVGMIMLSEPTAKRKEQAKAIVDRVIDPRTESVGDVCRELTGGKGVDVVFDCAGVLPALEAGFDALKRTGTFVNIAVWEKPIQLPFLQFFFKEIKVLSSCCYNDQDFKEVMELMAKGAFPGYEKMVTSRISLEDAGPKGFEELVNHKDDQIKILISPKIR
ncbi:chlorophyll synthesis pathway protein BchC [Fonsecaea erecta]|uniref:Chlorophyll synthesis pathway protein BchC n=1 Tax=Fonsecaea erecta TaxID=1367422 RepID=A0A178ZG47_9EURO|nr:chlorophyll synthesis pathway protein BchC [Fonsecaea erecta]OAP58748.1 chlorophyll synthesis pathway protein BchC [Fonsecaea erecta]